jgi:tetratricopeptide (TPR) repeat protein
MREEARRIANDVAAAFADDPRALGVLASYQHTVGKSQAAVGLWERGVTLDSTYQEGHFRLGTVALRREQFETASKWLQRARELDPDDARVTSALAAAWLGSGEVERAVNLLESCASTTVLPANALIVLGQCYLQQQEYAKSQHAFEELIEKSPNEPKAYYGLARASIQLGKSEEAQAYLKRFRELEQQRLERDIESSNAFSDAAYAAQMLVTTALDAAAVYAAHGESTRAETLWRNVAHLDPENLVCRQQLLRAYERQRRDRESLQVCEQICEIAPENPEFWFYLAVLRDRVEGPEGALAAIERAIGLAPEIERYREIREVIQQSR